jgi:glutamate N-acetyltransferase/amino-acid N-acetyltransferase
MRRIIRDTRRFVMESSTSRGTRSASSDAEGATKFVTVQVEGGRTTAECLRCIHAGTLAADQDRDVRERSELGRFCMAIGRAGVERLDPDRVALYLDDVCVARGGMIAPDYTEEAGARVMSQAEFVVRIDLGRGTARETIWTCDFSYEYVRINAEYRT